MEHKLSWKMLNWGGTNQSSQLDTLECGLRPRWKHLPFFCSLLFVTDGLSSVTVQQNDVFSRRVPEFPMVKHLMAVGIGLRSLVYVWREVEFKDPEPGRCT